MRTYYKFFIFFILVEQLMVASVLALAEEPLVVGIIEFEEISGIGQENAAIVIPEILINHLKNIGKYKLVERVLLKKALSEQELQMSGITDEEKIAQAGKVLGLDAFIVGSAMKVAKTISISSRLISTETAEILATGNVEFTNLKQLSEKLEELGYQLSNYSKQEYRKISFAQEMSRNHFSVRLGAGYIRNLRANLGSFCPSEFCLTYQSKWFDADLFGMLPLLNKDITFAALFNLVPFAHLGFGIGGFVNNDETEAENWFAAGMEKMQWFYFGGLLGFTYRIMANLRANLYFGTPLWGEIVYRDGQNNETKFSELRIFPLPYAIPLLLSVDYRFAEKWSVMPMFIWHNLYANAPEMSRPPYAMSIVFSLLIGYGFSF